MKVFDAIGFGALNIDKLFAVNRIAKAEEESSVVCFKETCGGSAANTIVGLARLGCKVGFIGKVGDEREGKMLLDDFRKENVDTSCIEKARYGRTGAVMGFIDKKGERALYVDPGVNDALEVKDAVAGYVLQAKFLHMTSFVGEKSFQAQKGIVKKLPDDVMLSFDPGDLYARRGFTSLESLIVRTRVLMPNAGELQLLTGTGDYEKGVGIMLEKGVKTVAVKLGSRGCYVADNNESHLIEGFKVKAVDTTGAGDAFGAGFLYGMLSQKSLYECGRIGNYVASRCIMSIGARDGLPRLTDLAKSGLA